MSSDDIVEATERVADMMSECSDRVGALQLLGFEARWTWCTADELPVIHVGRRTW